ncbi:MAG: hypothetical protein QM774_00095 [Gordonia sp. (in: high G+C Gram-positive bacteria)]|uniref:hypothetical protein n=1 Tax=Gordonia sp. (in: high G+C Gram-positive bacteria) TaxID=84139 RepID=UPI0039E2277A
MGDTGTATTKALPRLRPGLPVLVRSDGRLHLGCDPADALVLNLGPEADPNGVVALLDDLQRPLTRRQLSRRARSAGLTLASFTALLDTLVAAGRAIAPEPAPSRVRVRIHGDGALARQLTDSLAGSGLLAGDVPTEPGALAPDRRLDCNLLVPTDRPVVDPAIRLALMTSGTPHLPVVVRDGIGVIGPLVLPGMTGCLRCADLHRSDADPEWPALAARLTGAGTDADRHTVAATVAIAHHEIAGIARSLADPAAPAPQTLHHRLEVNAQVAGTRLVPAPPHARCGCVRSLTSPPTDRYPRMRRKDSVERDHTWAGATQCEAGGAAARRRGTRGRRAR